MAPDKLTLILSERHRRSLVLREVRHRARALGVEIAPEPPDDHRRVTVALQGDPGDVNAAADEIADWWVAARGR